MDKEIKNYDVIILGAGGAGMMCAARAGARGRKVVILDHAEKLGKKILISGGGRCNFTNLYANATTYFSQNEHFAKSALARFTPQDFLVLVKKHRIKFHEKKLGQQFCDHSAQSIVDLLEEECRENKVKIELNAFIKEVRRISSGPHRFEVESNSVIFRSESLVIATGGLSIPKIGASDFGYRIAKKFGLAITELSPALVALVMDQEFQKNFKELSGVSVDAEVSAGGMKFRENILFTHTGLSGPAILQISLYWKQGEKIKINLLPEQNLKEWLLEKKRQGSRAEVKNLLTEFFTRRLSETLCDFYLQIDSPIGQISDQTLSAFANQIQNWELKPQTNGGYGRAEVTRGGVNTQELSSKTMESKKVPGLFFIGEVVDVTGHLGGFNFQWAWASGVAAGEVV